jgi:hypothetical protein
MSTTPNNQALNTLDLIYSKYPLHNAYKDLYDTPDIRGEMVVQRKVPSILAWILDMRRKLVKDGSSYATVRTRKFLSQEIDTVRNPNLFKTLVGAAGTAGNAVSATIKSPYGNGGVYTVPVQNHLCTTRIKGEQVTALITNVTTGTAGAYVATLEPINGGAIDLSVGELQWLYNPRVQYTKSCTSSIQTEGFVETAPNIIRGNIQEYETGKHICQDELTNYRYETSPTKAQLFDQLRGEMVDTFCLLPTVMDKIRDEMIYADVVDLLFGEYNGVEDKGWDGLFTTAKKRGTFNYQIDVTDVASFLATVEIIMLRLKNEGIMKAVVFCDQEFMINVNKILAQLPNGQVTNFGLPIFVGSNQEPITWYNFTGIKNFLGISGLDIQFEVIEGWEQAGFTSLYQNFGLVIPSVPFMDNMGQTVPPVEIVKLKHCTGLNVSKTNDMWNNDLWYSTVDLDNGGRKLNVFSRTSFGVQIYGAKYMGILSGGGQCYS